MTHRYLDPTNDVAFKKLFSNKDRLIDLLNSILKLSEGSRIKELDYIPQEQMPLFLEGKRSIFDLKVKDEAGRWYIIEMQRKMERDYINRVQFYGSYSYVNQIEQGVSHKDLLPVVVISIIGQKVFDDELPCINYHCLKETNTNKQYLFSLMYVFVELGKFDSNKIENDIDQWLHLLKCAHNEQEPPKEIKNSSVLSAYEDLEQYRWNASEHDAYIRAKLAMEAEEIKVEEYLEKIEQAELKGKIDGELGKAEEIAKKMLARGKNAEEVAELTGLSLEKVNSLRKRPF
ncbi:Rpn family recombination-promoting nuclease/putative transposase (plasmid) [Candidatus Megaera polyxenophila]|uniref:Rpn family recombination-promoting nuclease/putative transposase n=1 Tax=Candidatus Megaera polyxenophila TaxID=988779 RepID=UPI00249E231A|nr:Rpn family recombination-promoting nuclease/putative transposase [Candidatus Megaera polyxenophila]